MNTVLMEQNQEERTPPGRARQFARASVAAPVIALFLHGWTLEIQRRSAVAAMIIAGTCGLFTLLGLVFGIIGLLQTKGCGRTGVRTMAIIGLIINLCLIVLSIILLVVLADK